MDKDKLEFASASFEDQQERVREFVNENRKILVEDHNEIEAIKVYLKDLVETLQNNNALPKAYGPPKYPPIKDKETCEEKGGKWIDGKCVFKGGEAIIVAMSKADCEEKGGKWDDETKTCKLPETKESQSLQGLGVLPSSMRTSDPDARAKALTAKVLGESE